MADELKLAIVGAGIGGCSAAAYLRDYYPTAAIHVFEQDSRIGGRVQTIEFHQCSIETGASFFHSSNVEMRGLVARVGLELTERQRLRPDEPRPIGVWDGDAFVTILRNTKLGLAVSLLSRYGVSVMRMRDLARQTLRKWGRIYRLQKAGATFESPTELLQALELSQLASRSAYQLFEDHRISERTVGELFNSISRSIYNQDARINGFAGMIALLGTGMAGGRTLSMADGNSKLCQGLLKQANALVRTDCRITTIRCNPGLLTRSVQLSDGHGSAGEFDAVIIAAPGKRSGIALYSGDGLRPWAEEPDTQVTYVSCVFGRLRADYFKVAEDEQLPQMVMTVESDSIPFSTILRNGPSDSTAAEHVYKIQSRRKLPPRVLEALFDGISDLVETEWRHAYPTLTPTEVVSSFCLLERVYYTSAMEPLASTLETQVVASRNVVSVLAKELTRGRRQ